LPALIKTFLKLDDDDDNVRN